MVAFIFLIVVGIVGLLALAGGIFGPRSGPRRDGLSGGARAGLGAAGIALMLLSVLTIVFGMMQQTVGAQDIGIVLNGGAPVGHIGPGRSFINPWENVVTMDNAVQKLNYNVADPSSSGCEILIRIANQQTACAEVKLRAQPVAAAVDTEYRQYRSTQGLLDGLVTPMIQKYANIEFQTFDPIADVNSTLPLGSPDRPTVQQIADRIERDLQQQIGTQVHIDNLIIPNIDYDGAVQAQLNAAFAQKAKTVIAQQAVQTADAQAAANRALAVSGSLNSLALVQQCMTWLNTLADKGLTPPAGFSCWPGAGSGVVIPSK